MVAIMAAIMAAIMRLSVIVLTIFAGTFVLGKPAQAQNYPWCAQYSGGDMGGAMNCGFVSFAQCMDTVRGMGGFCMVNTLYRPPGQAAPNGFQSRKHHARKRS